MIQKHWEMQLETLAKELGEMLTLRNWRVATAESCTGGGVSAAITAIPGSSGWFEYGVVTYANAAKQHLLGVSTAALTIDGAVSEAVVSQMVDGVLSLSGADIAVAISGIAGPGGGSEEKPTGSVWFAWGTASGNKATAFHHLTGDRREVQQQSVTLALRGLLSLLGGFKKD